MDLFFYGDDDDDDIERVLAICYYLVNQLEHESTKHNLRHNVFWPS